MIDIKATREAMAELHKQATEYLETYSKSETPATEDEEKAQADRFAKLEKLGKQIADAEKLATFAFSKEQPVAAKVIQDVKHPDQVAVEKPKIESYSREEYSKQLSSWARGDEREEYATISVTGNAAIVPSVVSAPITPVKYNCYRAAYAKLGMTPMRVGNTAPVTTPVVTSNSGGLIPEGTQNQSNDANPAFAYLTLPAHGYQSKTYWFSNEMINAETWDVTTSVLPSLQGAREYGFASAITAQIIADSGVTQSVSTASATTITIDNLDALIHSFSLLWDKNKVIFLGMDTYNACETLKDSNGRPIFEMFTVQDDSFLAYKGNPVFKHDTFQALTTAGNVVGCAISFDGFRLRDELEKLIKYVDNPDFVDQTGINDVMYQAAAYVPAAVTKLIAG